MRRKNVWMCSACLSAVLLAGSISAMASEGARTLETQIAESLQLTLVGTEDSLDWIYGSPAVRAVFQETGAALYTLDGTVFTEPIYDMWEFSYAYGYYTAMLADNHVDGWGVLDRDGSVAVPFGYNAIDVLSPEWAVAYTAAESSEENYDYVLYDESEHYYLYDTAFFYYLPDKSCAGSLSCDAFEEAVAVGHSINVLKTDTGLVNTYDSQFQVISTNAAHVYDDTYADMDYVRFYQNGACGLRDRSGNIILKPVYSGLEGLYGDYVEIYANGRCGLADMGGNLVIPAEYDYIRRNYCLPYDIHDGTTGYNAHGYFCVVQDGKIGFMNESGEVTCAPVYYEEALEQQGVSALYTNADGKACILAADGRESVLADYEEVYAEEFSAGMLYSVYDTEYRAGLIDWHGNELFPCEYFYFSVSGDGRYLLAFQDYDGMADIYRITYPGEEIVPEPEPETEVTTEAEPETESEAMTEAESEPEATTEAESETEVEATTEAETETESEVMTEAETEPETTTEAESETEMEITTEAEPETEMEITTEAEPETESEAMSEAETEPEATTETETMTEAKGFTLTQVAELAAVDWVSGTPNLLHTEDFGGSALVTLDNQQLTDPIYSSWDFEYRFGWICAVLAEDEEVSTFGLLAPDGGVVIPFEYGDVEVLSPEWAVAYTLQEADEDTYDRVTYGAETAYYRYDKAHVYYLPEKRCAAVLDREAYTDFAAVGHSINVENGDNVSTYNEQFELLGSETSYLYSETFAQLEYSVVYENGMCGLADEDGNLIIAAEYDWIYEPKRGYVRAELDGRYGMLNLEGNVVVPFEYDSFDEGYYLPYEIWAGEGGYLAGGYFAVEKDGRLGYVNEKGELTCEPVYDRYEIENYGASALLEKDDETCLILAADGAETLIEGYRYVYPCSYGSGLLYTVSDEDYNVGLMDWHGNLLLPCEYDDISLSGDGCYVLASKDYGESVLIYKIE